MIRPGRDEDASGLIALIGACWAEYPGCVMDLDEVPELRALATHYGRKGGALWVAEHEGAVAGVVATAPLGGEAWEIGRLYVRRDERGTGLAHRLLDGAEARARDEGAGRLVLWSDTRFDRAHAFYEKRGYLRSGPIRALGDRSNTIEFRYAKPLAGVAVAVLDAAAAASAERALASVLVACVDAGASVSFLRPLPPVAARAFWRRVAGEVARGRRALLGAWVDGALLGTVQLDLDTPPGQGHRAEVGKLLVHPDARRRGVGRALMRRAEQAARDAGRALLTLDTGPGGAGEALCRGLGWQEAGRIPGYTREADGSCGDTVIFWKRVEWSRRTTCA